MDSSKTGMKQSDFALLIIIVAFSLVVTYFIGNALINTDANRSIKVEKVQKIDPEFPIPDQEVFADGFINPTELIEIGNSNNPEPFTDGDQ